MTDLPPPAGRAPHPARLLFVHAHPDDETLATGVALATHALAGHDVHVLTATLGDEGEVIPADLAHLEAAREAEAGVPDDLRGLALAAHRRGELAAALAALGVTGHLLRDRIADVTDPAREPTLTYRDSGMAGTPSAAHPRALSGAPLAEVADAVRAVIADLRPDAVYTYDATGGYGHPDHIRVHEATCRAVADLPEADRPPLFAALVPRDDALARRRDVRARLTGRPATDPATALTVPADDDPWPGSVVDPDLVTHEVVGPPEALALRDAALRAHRTQVTLFDGGVYALSNDIAAATPDREGYALLDPATGRPRPAPTGSPAPAARPDPLTALTALRGRSATPSHVPAEPRVAGRTGVDSREATR